MSQDQRLRSQHIILVRKEIGHKEREKRNYCYAKSISFPRKAIQSQHSREGKLEH